MTLEEAKKILEPVLEANGRLSWSLEKNVDYQFGFVSYFPGDDSAALDGTFTADELEAIAVYMRATR